MKEFKIKLHRRFTGTDYHVTKTEHSYVSVLRDQGRAARTKVERNYKFRIPT